MYLTDDRWIRSFTSSLRLLGVTRQADIKRTCKLVAKRIFEAHDLMLRSYYAAKFSSTGKVDFAKFETARWPRGRSFSRVKSFWDILRNQVSFPYFRKKESHVLGRIRPRSGKIQNDLLNRNSVSGV